jgi:tetratricopeptide (TPR) repeat protein
MATKIDKKELTEPDKLQLIFLRVREFIETQRTRIYIGAGIFTLMVILDAGWYLYQVNYETSALKIYGRVFETATKAGPPAGDSTAINGYKNLIAQYPRSQAAIIASYRLGSLYLSRREIESAIIAYQDFLKKAPLDSDLVTLTYNNLASCYEIKKDFNKALEIYSKALNSNTASSFEVLNYDGIARVYEAMNNPVKAIEFYRKALDKTKDPFMTIYLKRKIAILG